MTTETLTLIQAAQAGDKTASARLIEENEGLIWSVVRRYPPRGAEWEDWYQLGCLGFLKAIQGFEASYGVQFSTYAVPKIAGEIRRFLRDDGPVKVSRRQKEQALTLARVRKTLTDTLGREPTLSELAEETGLPPEDIAAADLALAPVASLSAPISEDGLTLAEKLSSEGVEERLLERLALHTALDYLPEREKKLLLLRYFKGLTQVKTAQVLGVSQVQVSRLEKKALKFLRWALTAPELPDL